MRKPTPLQFINLIRSMFKLPYTTEGGCMRFHLVLKSVFPQAKGYWCIGHVISEIDGRYYDINGVVTGIKEKRFNPFEVFGYKHMERVFFNGLIPNYFLNLLEVNDEQR